MLGFITIPVAVVIGVVRSTAWILHSIKEVGKKKKSVLHLCNVCCSYFVPHLIT